MTSSLSFESALAFIWAEAELLDENRYDDWLALWSDNGLYVIPIEQHDEAYAERLNYAYDDQKMRRQRVARLKSRYAISAVSAAKTVRTVSRFVLADHTADTLTVRAAQQLVEYRRDNTRILAANLDITLVEEDQTLKLAKKVVKLINSEDALHGIGYLL